jgi:serine/threonine protein phosphatase PrpC
LLIIIQRNLLDADNLDKFNGMVCGSTCSLILIYDDQIISLSLGDSKCILGTQNNTEELVPVCLSVEHNTKNTEEVQRVINEGAIVQPITSANGKFLGPDRVWCQELTHPGLQITRGFGDLSGRECGISGKPGKTIIIQIS